MSGEDNNTHVAAHIQTQDIHLDRTYGTVSLLAGMLSYSDSRVVVDSSAISYQPRYFLFTYLFVFEYKLT